MGKGRIIGKLNNPSADSASGVWNLREQCNARKNTDNIVWPVNEIVTSGLILHLDAGNSASYPGSGTTWTDLSGSGYNFTVQSGSWVSAGAASYFNFGGSFCCAKRVVGGVLTDVPAVANGTIMVFSSILNSTANWRTLTRGAAAAGDHQVLIQQTSNILGMYDNTLPAAFISNVFDVSTILNYTTKLNCLYWKLSTSSPYYAFGHNKVISAGTDITNVNATFNNGFASIGGNHNNNTTVTSSTNASQYWGNIGVFLYYNRHLTNVEILQNYNALKRRYDI